MDTLEKNYIPRAKRGPMRRQSDRSLLRINNWPAAVAALALVLTLYGGSFAFFSNLRSETSKTQATVEENTRRIEKLESQSVTNVSLREYQDGQKVIDQRLDRIEKKLDAVAEYNRRH